MTRIEYDLMKRDHPELKFPDWYKFRDWQKNAIYRMKREIVIRERQVHLISGEFGQEFWWDV